MSLRGIFSDEAISLLVFVYNHGKFLNTDIDLARKLDAEDELASFRDEFVIDDPNLIYLDGNSLGRLPKRSIDFMKNTIEEEWGKRLIRVWNDGWVNTPTELGAKIAKLVGAKADEILVTEATSINLFKLAIAALEARPDRTEIISDEFNFPIVSPLGVAKIE